MGIIDELDKIVMREEDDEEFERDEERIAPRKTLSLDDDDEEENGAGVDEVLKYIEALQGAVMYIDKLTTKEPGNNSAFEAEVAIRKALEKMENLSKDVYKSKSKTER